MTRRQLIGEALGLGSLRAMASASSGIVMCRRRGFVALAVDPDSRRAVLVPDSQTVTTFRMGGSAPRDGFRVELVDLDSLKTISTRQFPGRPGFAAFLARGKKLVIDCFDGSKDSSVRVINADLSAESEQATPSKLVDGYLRVYGGFEHPVYRFLPLRGRDPEWWETRTEDGRSMRREWLPLGVPTPKFPSVAMPVFARRRPLFVYPIENSHIVVRNSHLEPVRVWEMDPEMRIERIAISDDGSTVGAALVDRGAINDNISRAEIRLWRTESDRHFDSLSENGMHGLGLSSDGALVALATRIPVGGRDRVWDLGARVIRIADRKVIATYDHKRVSGQVTELHTLFSRNGLVFLERDRRLLVSVVDTSVIALPAGN